MMKIRYQVIFEKEVPEFERIKDIDDRHDAIYKDMKNNENDYTDAKVIKINSDIREVE